MSFRKAKCEQAYLKIGMYGKQGSGKTFSALLFAEGLAAKESKRVAFVDTETGGQFYAEEVKSRKVHPEPFDYDVINTRSLQTILEEFKALDFSKHGVFVIDSMTHVWEAAIAAYNGARTKANTIPLNAWSGIKRPYKELITAMLNAPIHIIIAGREGLTMETDDADGESKPTGTKMKAEGETGYEPHILIRFSPIKRKDGDLVPAAYFEKDRTGVLAYQTIQWPSFKNCIEPFLPLLGKTQVQIEDVDAVAAGDAEKIADKEAERANFSASQVKTFKARFDLAKNKAEVNAIGKEITGDLKKKMLTEDVTILRDAFNAAIEGKEVAHA